MASGVRLILTLVLIVTLCNLTACEIHRAKSLKSKTGTKTGSRGGAESHHTSFSSKHAARRGHSRETWIYSILSAGLVGLSGVFPLLVIPIEAGKALRKGAPAAHLKLLLSFAVGGLLGDVFLHLLPEAWKHVQPADGHRGHMNIGTWVLLGILTFLVIEKIFPDSGDEDDEDDDDFVVEEKEAMEETHTKLQNGAPFCNGTKIQNGTKLQNGPPFCNGTKLQNGTPFCNGTKLQNGMPFCNGTKLQNGVSHTDGTKLQNGVPACNGYSNGVKHRAKNGVTKLNGVIKQNGHSKLNGYHEHLNGAIQNGVISREKKEHPRKQESSEHIKTSGWLNLMANVVDNFTHGLAVAGSYCAGTKSGILTTIIILLHEIPHEVGDFAILLRSGFDRWKAAQAQIITASGGLIGAVVALSAESAASAGDSTAWILPFTSGGFIYIALVTVVPDLLKETNPWESLKQMILLCGGIGTMAGIAMWLDEHDLPSFDWLIPW